MIQHDKLEIKGSEHVETLIPLIRKAIEEVSKRVDEAEKGAISLSYLNIEVKYL